MKKSETVPTMETPVIKYWGFKEHPFADDILEGAALEFFVNREHELHRLHNCITNRLTGVTGTPGVGKSSFFKKFKEELDSKYPVIFVQMAGKSEKTLFREILKAVLSNIDNGRIKTSKTIDIKTELERLQHSIQLTKEAEFGASAVFNGKLKETRSKKVEAHTEESATELIQGIIQCTRSAFVVIIDDLERVKFLFENENLYFRFIVLFSRTIYEALSHPGVSFIVSIDENFSKRVGSYDNPTIDEDNTLSFGAIIEMRCFNPHHQMELISKRLNNK